MKNHMKNRGLDYHEQKDNKIVACCKCFVLFFLMFYFLFFSKGHHVEMPIYDQTKHDTKTILEDEGECTEKDRLKYGIFQLIMYSIHM